MRVGAIVVVVLSGFLAGCGTVADRFSPEGGESGVALPGRFLRDGGDGGVAMPDGGKWWEVFGDKELERLVERCGRANREIGVALARVRASHAALGVTRAAMFPTLLGEGSSGLRRDSVNNLLFPLEQPEYERYQLGATATWELDLWGRVRALSARDRLRAEAEDARFAGAVLSVQGEMARQYFAYRSAEREEAILRDAVAVRDENLRLQTSRLELGDGTALEVARARAELESARAALESAKRSRGKLRHAIAVLAGETPEGFGEIAAARGDWASGVPRVPAGVPVSLLERRPDVWAAARDVRAAAKEVGVQVATFLPRVTLTGGGGVSSLKAADLLAGADSSFFDVGPQVDVPLFQAGRMRSAVRQARAQWEEAKATYEGVVLEAVREVDDALLEVKTLGRELKAERAAAAAAGEAVELARLRYERGLVSYLEVVDAERTRLQAVRVANALAGEQRSAAVRLVQALGGSWGVVEKLKS